MNVSNYRALTVKTKYLLLALALASVLIMLVGGAGVMAQEPTATPSPQLTLTSPFLATPTLGHIFIPTLVPNGDTVIRLAGDLFPKDADSYPYNRQTANPDSQDAKSDLVYCHFETREAGSIQDIRDKVNFNPSNPYIYPGSVIQGRSLLNGAFAPITIPKGSGGITVTGINLGNVDMHREVSTLDEGSVEAAINDVLAHPLVGQPANIVSDYYTATSKEELLLQLGLDARYGGASLSGDFMKQRKSTNTIVVAKYIQIFYNVNLDPPTYSYSLFKDGINFENINGQISLGNPPLYVNSVGYGRMLMLSAESEYDEDTVKAGLKAGYEGTSASIKVHGDLTSSDIMQKTKISYIIYGGSASDQVKVINAGTDTYQQFLAVITDVKLASYSPANPGLPIVYSVSYLKDRNSAAIAYAGTFRLQVCSALPTHNVVFNFTHNHPSGAVVVNVDGETVLFMPGGSNYPGGSYPAKGSDVPNLSSYFIRMPDENGNLTKYNIAGSSAFPLDLGPILDYLEKRDPGNKQHLVSIMYDHYWCGKYSLNINASVDSNDVGDVAKEIHSINGTPGWFGCKPLKTWEYAVDRTSDNPVIFLREYNPS
ncbi:MAG: thiol-activated cytolysin family protein [Chloroflexota bacterium]